MTSTELKTEITENQVIYRKYFEVSNELLFDVWSDPIHLKEWWGPDGFTLTVISFDFRNGGFFEFVMHGPDGRDYKNKIQFLKIEKPRLISYQHIGDGEGDEDVNFQSEIVFEPTNHGKCTNLTMVQVFSTKQELERVNQKYGAIEGGKQHVGNLTKYLETLSKVV
ncbi:MAG: SRPBCC domain-containing protein [Leptospira sp.]|uniref:SRPBCC domain-containing protein n=1 Tax=Leptospira paudalimensis TaxID=2950024 RepID=A0ABT3M7E9_9LEPT|nr:MULTISPECIES: SRPBCC domain-containing protein [Leptospira]MBL0956315.1 SRPBCC domain-containing protein [Leptospira sp.]MCW7504109.1 SRPBCC domain-containing protein [Leptospira paudalimensis]